MTTILDLIDHTLTALSPPATKRADPKPDPAGAVWHEFSDLGVPGWSLAALYTVEREPGDMPYVTIHRAELNTGDRCIRLTIDDLPNVTELEAEISEDVEAADYQAAKELARDPKDDGDYAHDAALDRRGGPTRCHIIKGG